MPVRAVVSDMRKMHVGCGSPFLFQIYTGKSVADPGECIGMCVEDSIYHTGSVWTSWNSGVGCTCILWSDILLYASFC